MPILMRDGVKIFNPNTNKENKVNTNQKKENDLDAKFFGRKPRTHFQ